LNDSSALQNLMPTYIREILSASQSNGVISFAGGLPATESFPLDLMQQAFNDLTQHSDLFQYAQTQGYDPLLTFLRQSYQTLDSHDLLMTSGSQQGLDLIARVYINPGDKVVVEYPSYLGALQVFQLAQAQLLTVPQLGEGPDLSKLQLIFASQKVKFFYLIADFHNPTGICYSLQVRQSIAKLCQQYQVTIIEDAPYRELRFSGETLPLVSSFYPQGSIVLRSFSKIACPGMRLGSIEAPRDWIQQLITVKQISDIHLNTVLQYVLLQLLTHAEFPGHLLKLRQLYGDRHDLMLQQIQSTMGDRVTVEPVSGGMFLWLTLNRQSAVDMMNLAIQALEAGVAFVPGAVFTPDQDGLNASCRLNFSHSGAADICTGIQRLAKII
ncbi:MAG: PLP-dependent aminotransferase family protein, partial [Pseudomonadales bacterium]|nr:PLP-dependent aminotransferase family protein [Pseudomonadales bacterium]